MRLKEIRINNNCSQQDVAEILGVKRNTYTMWELEHDKIPLTKLIKLAEHFNVSLDYIFEFTDLETYPECHKFNKDLYLTRIKEIRKYKKVTQEALAKKLNTTNSVISRYEKGETFILTMFLIQYCKIFNVSADYLLGKIDNPKYLKNSK